MPAGGNLGPGIGNIRLNQQERAQIVEFLKALTDDRVRFERAPFDHPSLCVPVGYRENPPEYYPATPPRQALTLRRQICLHSCRLSDKEVMRRHSRRSLEMLQSIGRDGSRAHTLQQACILKGAQTPISVRSA
jgi:hypothetical protein